MTWWRLSIPTVQSYTSSQHHLRFPAINVARQLFVSDWTDNLTITCCCLNYLLPVSFSFSTSGRKWTFIFGRKRSRTFVKTYGDGVRLTFTVRAEYVFIVHRFLTFQLPTSSSCSSPLIRFYTILALYKFVCMYVLCMYVNLNRYRLYSNKLLNVGHAYTEASCMARSVTNLGIGGTSFKCGPIHRSDTERRINCGPKYLQSTRLWCHGQHFATTDASDPPGEVHE